MTNVQRSAVIALTICVILVAGAFSATTLVRMAMAGEVRHEVYAAAAEMRCRSATAARALDHAMSDNKLTYAEYHRVVAILEEAKLQQDRDRAAGRVPHPEGFCTDQIGGNR